MFSYTFNSLSNNIYKSSFLCLKSSQINMNDTRSTRRASGLSFSKYLKSVTMVA